MKLRKLFNPRPLPLVSGAGSGRALDKSDAHTAHAHTVIEPISKLLARTHTYITVQYVWNRCVSLTRTQVSHGRRSCGRRPLPTTSPRLPHPTCIYLGSTGALQALSSPTIDRTISISVCYLPCLLTRIPCSSHPMPMPESKCRSSTAARGARGAAVPLHPLLGALAL